MKILVLSLLLLFSGFAGVGPSASAFAQSQNKSSVDISSSLARLQNIPQYQGRVLGTHLRRSNGGYVYEVRILRDNDTVIIVFISPQTGSVVGDSEQHVKKSRTKKKKNR